jgi:quercetin dioxygenase-like cupin family protein
MNYRERALKAFADEGLLPHEWREPAGAAFPKHDHPYEKLIYCVEGGVEFELPREKRVVDLHPGERLVLPAHTQHTAFVGPAGCVCVEGHRFPT